jgi:hypothetical protein
MTWRDLPIDENKEIEYDDRRKKRTTLTPLDEKTILQEDKIRIR